MELPPQPKLFDFHIDGVCHQVQYEAALKAWEQVCKEMVKASREVTSV